MAGTTERGSEVNATTQQKRTELRKTLSMMSDQAIRFQLNRPVGGLQMQEIVREAHRRGIWFR